MRRTYCTIIPSSLHHLSSKPITTNEEAWITTTIVDSLKQGLNWDTLTQKFTSTQLNNSITQQVLLTLKEPRDAKLSLGFFHWSAHRSQSHHQLSNYAIAIHLSCKGKLIKDARALIESVLNKEFLRDIDDANSKSKSSLGYHLSFVDSLISSYGSTNSVPLVFDLLVQTYAKLRMLDLGFDVCRYLGEKGFSLSFITYNTLLHTVQRSDKTALVWKIYEHMIIERKYPNEATMRILVSALCKEGKLQDYMDMLDRIHMKRCSPSVIVNASLVFRVLEEGRVNEGMILTKRLLQKGMNLDIVSYSIVVYARVRFGSIDSGLEVYEEMLNRGFQPNSFIYTVLIGAYCKEGKVDDAIRLMQEMIGTGLKPYSETFNHLILGCSKVGILEESMKFCKEMMEMGLVPSCSAFNDMVGKLGEMGSVKEANDMLTSILDKGFKPDEITYVRLIGGYSKEGKIQEVLNLYHEMVFKSFSPCLLVFEPLISCLCKCGKLAEAEKYLKVMKVRSIPSSRYIYETLIDCYRAKGDKMRALQLYHEMEGK